MRKSLLIVALFIIGLSKSFGQDIYTYGTNTSGIPDYTDPLLGSFTNLTAVSTGSATPCGSGFSGMNGWPTSVSYSSTGPCVQITLTASAGYILKVTGFTANLRRSGTGPNYARLAYSVDGVTWIDDGVDHVPYNGSCAPGGGTTLASWTTFCVSNTTLYFRIYAYDAGAATGTLQIYSGLSIIGSVLAVPTAPAVTAAGPTSFCAGGNVLLNASTGAGYTYQWYNGTTAIAGATAASYTATVGGSYYVDLTSGGLCAGSDTSLHTIVTVNPSPVAVVSAGGPTSFCTPATVTLSETSGTGTSYQWYNGSGPIFGATDATYTASTTARDSVMITNSYGCMDTSSAIVITAYTTPTAVVTPAGPVAICAGSSATLTASAGAGYTYQWYNGTGAIAGATNATLVVNSAGRDSVMITGPGGCTATSNTVITSLNPSPSPTIGVSGPTTFCTPGSVTISETSGTGTIYQWYNTTGAITGATNSSYIASATGRDSVRVTNSYGCSVSSAVTIVTANTTPAASVSPAGPLAICSGSSSVLTASTGAGYTYQWYDGSGAISGATNSFHSVSTAGRDSVIITGAGGCSATSNTVIVSVNPAPDPTTTASGPLSFCPGDSVTLTATAGAGYTFQWRNGGGAIPGATDISYTTSASGTYRVRVTNSYGCAVNSSNFTVVVFTAPSTAVTYSGPVSFCSGGNVVISAETVAGDVYQWYNVAGAITGATHATYTATTSGDYYAIINNTNGCTSTTVSTHVVEVAPPFLTPLGPTAFCQGGGVILSGSTSGASGITYQWIKDGVNISGATNSTYIANTSGNYTCLITVSPACFTTTTAISVVVRPTPNPVITDDGHLHLSTDTSYLAYQWYVNTVVIPGATNSTVTIHEIGSYRVLVRDTNICPALSVPHEVYILAGVNDIHTGNTVSIYPNPAAQVLHIAGQKELRAVITSVEGKIMIDRSDVSSIDISSLTPGVYIVMLYNTSGERLLVEKLVKE